jgi:hypothetical protein
MMPKSKGKAKTQIASGGALTISNDPNKGVVILKFDGPVSFMSLHPVDARRLR